VGVSFLALPTDEEVEPFGELELALALEVASVGVVKGEVVGGVALDVEVALVHISVAFGAEAEEVVGHGLALVGVEFDVVNLEEEVVGAAGGFAAVAVAADELGALGGGGQAGFGVVAEAGGFPVGGGGLHEVDVVVVGAGHFLAGGGGVPDVPRGTFYGAVVVGRIEGGVAGQVVGAEHFEGLGGGEGAAGLLGDDLYGLLEHLEGFGGELEAQLAADGFLGIGAGAA